MTPKRTATPTRAAVYDRQSKAAETEGSPETQREQGRHFALAKGATSVVHYSDVGRSGYDPSVVREGFEAMMLAATRREFDLLVVFKLDRLTRQGVAEALRIEKHLRENGVTLVSVHEPWLDTSSPIGRGIFGLIASVAEQEAENIRLRTAGTKEKQRARGGWTGGFAPYGFRPEREVRDGYPLTILREEPAEAAVVREAAELVAAGSSLRQVANALEAHGYPAPSGGAAWHAQTVANILRSPALVGWLPGPNGEPVAGEDGLPVAGGDALVPVTLWRQVVETLDGRRGTRQPKGGLTLLSGLAVCSGCGGPITGDRKAGGGYGSYSCARRATNRCPAPASVAMVKADRHVARTALTYLAALDPSDPDDADRLAAIAERWAEQRPGTDPHAAERAAAAEAVRLAEEALSRLDNDRADGLIEGERYATQVRRLQSRKESAEDALAGLTPPAVDITPLLDLAQSSASGEDPLAAFEALPMEDRREIVRAAVSLVEVKKSPRRHVGSAWHPDERLSIHLAGDVA